MDPAPEQAVSEGDASDSEGSESASDSDQNDPPSSLVADAEQYELMQIAYAAVGKDFTGQEDYWVGVQQAPEIGDGSREMVFGKVILLATNMCGPPGSGRMLLGRTGHTYYPLRITTFLSPSGEVSDHEAGCMFGQRGCCHSQGDQESCTMTVRCICFAPIIGYSRFTRN